MPKHSAFSRFFVKKRGERRTGPVWVGSAGLTVFFASLLFVGACILAAVFTFLFLPEVAANRRFVQNTCRVVDKKVDVRVADEIRSYRPRIEIEYTVDGQAYRTWTYRITQSYSADISYPRQVISRYEVGEEYPCWYDPLDPSRAVLELQYTKFVWLMLLLPSILMALGGTGLAFTLSKWGVSDERRAAMARRALDLDPFDRGTGVAVFPNIPSEGPLTDSPGTTLAFRLPMRDPHARTLVALIVGCVLWNSMVSVFGTLAVESLTRAQFDWLLLGVSLCFAILGGWLILICFRRILDHTAMGRTLVEISDHPLYPGRTYQVFVSQSGRLTLRKFKVLFVCEETATFREGTNPRIEKRRVYSVELVSREKIQVQPGAPLEVTCELELPEGAMHSFKSPNNSIDWQIVVEGRPRRLNRFERTFPIVVYPSRNEALLA